MLDSCGLVSDFGCDFSGSIVYRFWYLKFLLSKFLVILKKRPKLINVFNLFKFGYISSNLIHPILYLDHQSLIVILKTNEIAPNNISQNYLFIILLPFKTKSFSLAIQTDACSLPYSSIL